MRKYFFIKMHGFQGLIQFILALISKFSISNTQCTYYIIKLSKNTFHINNSNKLNSSGRYTTFMKGQTSQTNKKLEFPKHFQQIIGVTNNLLHFFLRKLKC